MHVKVNYKNISNLVTYDELLKTLPKVEEAHKTLVNKSGAGNDFLGWVDWPLNYDKEEYDRIKKAAEKIRKDSEVLVVIGIGGSYLGAKAVIEAMKEYFTTEKQVEIIFAGHTLSSTYTAQLLKYLENKEFSINVISKSGTTTEPAVAFRIFRDYLPYRYCLDDWPLYHYLRGLADCGNEDEFIRILAGHLALHQSRTTYFAPEMSFRDYLDSTHCVPSQLILPLAISYIHA